MQPGRVNTVAALLGWLCLTTAAHAADGDGVVWGCDDAGYSQPTTEYPHGVLGDEIEYKALTLMVETTLGVFPAEMVLPDGKVFEDLAPRCGDLTGDGEDEVVAIVSDAEQGAQLAVYSKKRGPIDTTPPIGQRFRWLAPVGIADLNGDGRNDIAYVETPHIGGMLRVWTLQDGKLVEIASAPGYSNHRIGQDFITGGVRDCGQGPELLVPNFDWSALLSVRMQQGVLVSETISGDTARESVDDLLKCGSN